MRTKGLLVIAILFFQQLYAQDTVAKKRPAYLAISLGAGFPGAEWGRKSLSEPSGFAQIGWSGSLSYYKWLGDDIGFVMIAQYQQNTLDAAAMESELSKKIFATNMVVWSGSGQVPTVPGSVYTGWKVDKKSWRAVSILPGIFSEMPIDRKGKTIFTSRIAVGAINLAAPALQATIVSDTLNAALHQTGKSAWGFSYQVASGVKLELSRKIHLLVNLAYQGSANITFKDIVTKLQVVKGQVGSPGAQAYMYQTTAGYKQRYSSINAEAGIVIDL